MTEPEMTYILPCEHVGEADAPNGVLDIGGLEVDVSTFGRRVSVYVRRSSSDLSVIEIAMARHDGLAQEELDRQNDEADHHPQGPKEYWRLEMVGKYTYGADGHVMTDEDFEADWDEGE